MKIRDLFKNKYREVLVEKEKELKEAYENIDYLRKEKNEFESLSQNLKNQLKVITTERNKIATDLSKTKQSNIDLGKSKGGLKTKYNLLLNDYNALKDENAKLKEDIERGTELMKSAYKEFKAKVTPPTLKSMKEYFEHHGGKR